VLGITAETPDPEGGVIRRVPDTSDPNGVLEELAAIPCMPRVLNPVDERAAGVFLLKGQAVSRTSRSGAVIGASERLTPYEALKCITEWSAYQHFEEDRKGTLEAGKLADLVILDRNPLRVDVDEIKDILVDETIKDGDTVYIRGPAGADRAESEARLPGR